MSTDFYNILGLILFGLLLITGLVETILSGTWNNTYFTNGIPIFAKRIPVGLRHSNIPPAYHLETRFRSTWSSSLVFKEIDLYTYGFREKFFEIRFIGYTPVMHGVLVFDNNNNEVVVIGLLNWYTLFFSLIWLAVITGIMLSSVLWVPVIGLGFVLFYVLVMGSLYSIQHDRFSKVATFAAESWSRKYAKDVIGA